MVKTNIEIRDAQANPQNVGTFDDGTQQHATNVPLSAEISEQTGITLTSTATTIAIDPQCTYLLIDFGSTLPTGASTGRYGISGRYTTGGAQYPLDYWFLLPPHHQVNRISRDNTNSATPSTNGPRWVNNASDNFLARVVVVPIHGGIQSVDLYVGSLGSQTGVAVRQMGGPVPQRPTRDTPMEFYNGTTLTNSAVYAAGDCIGGDLQYGGTIQWSGLGKESRPLLQNATFGAYNCNLVDFDVVISHANYNSGQLDNEPPVFSYPEGVVAWLECRTVPAAGQFAVRDGGSGGYQVCPMRGLDVQSIWAEPNTGANNAFWFDVCVIDRTGVTLGTSPSFYMEGAGIV